MQQYKYTAYNLRKEKFTGIFIANDQKDLAVQLAKQNLFLISCKKYSGATPSAFFTLGTGEVSITELNTFCRQFAIMVTAGMSMMECLAILKSQSFSDYFKSVLEVVYEDVKSGKMLSEAVNKHPKVFPDFFRSMVGVGEVSGKMNQVLNALADYYERDSEIKSKAKSALSYPIMLLFITLALFIAMMFFIVPTFRESLSSLDITPEGLTKICYDMSDWFMANWTYIILGLILVFGIYWGIGRTEKGKNFYAWVTISFPVFKDIQIDMITARFARGFSLLISSGLNIADALDAITVVIGNRELQKRFTKAAEDVRVGMSLAKSIEKYKVFPTMMIQMIQIGEETASLAEVLNRSCSFFDTQAEETITRATGILQPVMLVFMGAVVGVMFIAIYSPMISIMTAM